MNQSTHCLAICGAVLLVTISFELSLVAMPEDDATAPDRVGAIFPNFQQSQASRSIDERVSIILQRPLFSPDRRQASHAELSATAFEELPRLCGIVVSRYGREAVFARKDDERPMTLQEGSRLGAFTIKSIEAKGVTVVAGGSVHILRPTAENNSDVSTAAAQLRKEFMPVSVSMVPPRQTRGESADDDSARLPIPDLAQMRLQDREYWVERWRQETARMDPAEQDAYHEQMRAYWQKQWAGAWGSKIGKLSAQDQARIRRRISGYWH